MSQELVSHFSFDVNESQQPSIIDSEPTYLIHAEGYLPKNFKPNASKDSLDSLFKRLDAPSDSLLPSQKVIYWKTNLSDYRFNTDIFIKSLFFYFLYYFIFGPTFLVFRKLFENPILNNLLMPTIQGEAAVLHWIVWILPLGYLSFILDDFAVLMPSVIALYMNLLFVIVTQASMAAFTNTKASELFTSTMMSPEQVKVLKKVEIGDEYFELRNTFNRLNINITRLYFEFMEERSGLDKVFKKQIDNNQDKSEYLVKDGRLFLLKMVKKENLIKEALEFEKAIFNMKSYWQKTHLDDHKMFGYNLAMYVLAANKQEISSKMGQLIFLTGILQAAIIHIKEFRQIVSSSEDTFLFLSLNFLFYMSMLFIIMYLIDILLMAFLNMKRRKGFMFTLGNLITPGSSEKCPNLNVFDYMSLKTWMKLRKVFMNYGDRQMETIGLIMTLFVGSHAIVGVLLFLDYMRVLEIFGETLRFYVVTFFVGGQFFTIFFIMIIAQALSVNQQFHKHKELIRRNRELVGSMYRLYPNYIAEEQALEPENAFEAQALRLLRKEFGDCEYKEKMESQLRVLMETYDDILKDLEFEEHHYPITLIGIKIAPNLVKTLVTAIGTAGFASLAKYISSLTSK